MPGGKLGRPRTIAEPRRRDGLDREAELLRLQIETGDTSDLPRRPETRRQCAGGIRPCPFVSCRFNLYLDVTPCGSLLLNFPGLEPHEMPAKGSCALDVAGLGPHNLTEVGRYLNVTRGAIDVLLAQVFAKLAENPRLRFLLREFIQESPEPQYRLPIFHDDTDLIDTEAA